MIQTKLSNSYSVDNYTVHVVVFHGHGTVEVYNKNNGIIFNASLTMLSSDLERKESLLIDMATSAISAIET